MDGNSGYFFFNSTQMKTCIQVWLLLGMSLHLSAQEAAPTDTLSVFDLEEVIIVSKPIVRHYQQQKPLSTVDEFLEKSGKVSMIKRGAYAWEPMVNSMSSERLAVTIDGMHIFGACTDKMDPVTSYVDVSNLSEVNVYSGQQGPGFGPAIGGAINMVRHSNQYDRKGWSAAADMGQESNGWLQTYGAAANYTGNSFFVDADFMTRRSNNYLAGGREEIAFSQFTKYNLSATAGKHWQKKHFLEASLIYDRAVDVGYPALPMDVALARAIISSLRYEKSTVGEYFHNWETKLYYNSILHQMDDSQRPDVPIRMDMPGWSNTAGFYSRISGCVGKHSLTFNLNGYHNQSLAEMTMFPNNPDESSMFMLTWPDVRTTYSGFFAEDKISLKDGHAIQLTFSSGIHTNKVADDFGLNSLRIFYPEMSSFNIRSVNNLSAGYSLSRKEWEMKTSIGYGQRAPSVSEGYGFYLFNSFDGFDYVGNPEMPNESAVELHFGGSVKLKKFKIGASANYFHFLQYIIGVPDPVLSAMTIGARGVKVYTTQDQAHIFNTDLNAQYSFLPNLILQANVAYSLGRDAHGNGLPLIRPFSYSSALTWRSTKFFAEASVGGNSRQWAFSETYGEDATKGFAIVNLSGGYTFYFNTHRLFLKGGIENLLDSRYSTFADWNNLLRKGRSFYLNISLVLDKKRDR